MSEYDIAVSDGLYHFSLERDNRDLVSTQVQKINSVLRKVRRLNKDSQREMPPVVSASSTLSSRPVVEAKASSIPNLSEGLPPDLVAQNPNRSSEDTTEKFLIKDPSRVSSVASAFRRAFEAIEKEEAQFRRKNGKGSPIVKLWDIA